MLVDRESHPLGNVVIEAVSRQSEYTVHVLTKAEKVSDTRPRYFAHAAYCGQAHPPVPSEPVAELSLFESVVTFVDSIPVVHYEPSL